MEKLPPCLLGIVAKTRRRNTREERDCIRSGGTDGTCSHPSQAQGGVGPVQEKYVPNTCWFSCCCLGQFAHAAVDARQAYGGLHALSSAVTSTCLLCIIAMVIHFERAPPRACTYTGFFFWWKWEGTDFLSQRSATTQTGERMEHVLTPGFAGLPDFVGIIYRK